MLRTAFPSPISTSRGGMGEAQGDPPRHFRRSTRRGERMPNGSAESRSILLFLRRDARDPSYRTRSARSSRISKNISKNSVFRPDHAYFLAPQRLYAVVTHPPPSEAISFVNMCIIGPKAPRTRARSEISPSEGRNPLLARDVLQKMTYCKTRARTSLFHVFAVFAKRYAQR